MNTDGTELTLSKDFQGLERSAARKKIIIKLKELKLFVESKSYIHTVPFSERSK